jgi:hypothetical protein
MDEKCRVRSARIAVEVERRVEPVTDVLADQPQARDVVDDHGRDAQVREHPRRQPGVALRPEALRCDAVQVELVPQQGRQ